MGHALLPDRLPASGVATVMPSTQAWRAMIQRVRMPTLAPERGAADARESRPGGSARSRRRDVAGRT
jgi:hypothetical protein